MKALAALLLGRIMAIPAIPTAGSFQEEFP
jgi:hypothetical protein